VQLATLGVLQIERAVPTDQGLYRCEAANEARTRRSNDATLVVNTATADTGQFPRSRRGSIIYKFGVHTFPFLKPFAVI